MKLDDASLLKQDAWIAGRWTAAVDGRRIAIRNPANGTVVGEVPMMGAVETRTAIEAAAAALSNWSRKTAKERAVILRRFADLMIANTNDLAIIMTAEQGIRRRRQTDLWRCDSHFPSRLARAGITTTCRRRGGDHALELSGRHDYAQARSSPGGGVRFRMQASTANTLLGTRIGGARTASRYPGRRL